MDEHDFKLNLAQLGSMKRCRVGHRCSIAVVLLSDEGSTYLIELQYSGLKDRYGSYLPDLPHGATESTARWRDAATLFRPEWVWC